MGLVSACEQLRCKMVWECTAFQIAIILGERVREVVVRSRLMSMSTRWGGLGVVVVGKVGRELAMVCRMAIQKRLWHARLGTLTFANPALIIQLYYRQRVVSLRVSVSRDCKTRD